MVQSGLSRYSAITLFIISVTVRFCPSSSFRSNCYLHKSCCTNSKESTVHGNSYNIYKKLSTLPPYSRDSVLFLITKTDLNGKSDEDTEINDNIFGSEFKIADNLPEEPKTYWRGNIQYTEISPEKRGKVMDGYNNLRITFLLDNLFISALGLCLIWSFGTFKDAFSYGIGSFLGLGYAALLARYVESLGSKQGGGAGGGAARFAPVVLLILLYSKNKEFISIVPEILGFFTFQVASLLQIFNEDAYGEAEAEKK